MGDYSEKLKVVIQEGEAALADLPESAPVFGTRTWLAATSRALPFPLRILKVYKGESFAAWLPVQEVSRGPFRKAFTPMLTFYGGPYFAGEPRKHFNEEVKQRYEILAALLARLEERAHYCMLLPEDIDVRPALERGWACTPRFTVINRLADPDCLEVNRAAGKNIRKAERLGLELRESVDAGAGQGEFEAAFARTFARKGLAMSWQPRWAADLRRELAGSGLLENLAVATPEGKEIAFASVALDAHRDAAILWYSCSLAEADQAGAMHFLYHRLLERYRGRYGVFDLCGADHRSLSEFKEKFGRELAVRHCLEKYRGGFSKAALNLYARARRRLA
jgi:hypothetical protein